MGAMTPIVEMVIALLGLASVWGALRQRLISHEELDRERFGTMEELLKEVRRDVRVILRGNGYHDRESNGE